METLKNYMKITWDNVNNKYHEKQREMSGAAARTGNFKEIRNL